MKIALHLPQNRKATLYLPDTTGPLLVMTPHRVEIVMNMLGNMSAISICSGIGTDSSKGQTESFPILSPTPDT